MPTQMSEAMKSAKSIQTEMVQWENRLESAKSEYGNLQRNLEALKGQIDQKRSDYDTYISTREKQTREGIEAVNRDRQTLDIQQKEFADILAKHNKDKVTLAQERVTFEREKNLYNGRKTLVNDFIQAVRRAYNVLPEE